MVQIGTPVRKQDHEEKMSGAAQYIGDMTWDGMRYAAVVRSTIASGRIRKIQKPTMEEGYDWIDASDIPGENLLKVVTSEQPIFAVEKVCYVGEAIGMIVGKEKAKVLSYVKQVIISYEEESPILDIEEAKEVAASYGYKKGNAKQMFLQAKEIVEETFTMGYQEQAYIEPQGVVGIYKDGNITVYGSMQCPYYVHGAVEKVMGLEGKQVQIIQTTTGGGFGGKEDYPSMLGCQVAVAAKKVGVPIQLILDRREDMLVTPKRHPAKITYWVALDHNRRIQAMEVDITLDAGAYAGLSSVVLQRTLLAAVGVYRIEHLEVRGKAVITNLVPTGAFRGFGGPQSFFAMESLMNHLAHKIGETPLAIRGQYMSRQGDRTPTNGLFHHYVPYQEMLQRMEAMSNYSEKYKQYQGQSKEKRYQKGIGFSFFLHGCGFTGSAEKDYIRSVVQLEKRADGKVEILAANTEMGQGLKTTFSKIVANELQLPLSEIIFENPDTNRVPNSGPTVASRSIMIVGKLLERGAKRMKERWAEETFLIEEHYIHPDMIPWDSETFQGDAYPTFSYGMNVIEVETDRLLGTTKVIGAFGVFDVGKVIDENIVRGQAEGGMLQGIGYASMEKMEQQNGHLRQFSFTDYMIPTSKDTVEFGVEFIENLYEHGPYGAKGLGELTIIGAAPAYAAAVEQAAAVTLYELPITPEKLMEAMGDD